MDAISGIASITQLVDYSYSVALFLGRIFTEVQNGPTILRQQASSIEYLLNTVQCLRKDYSTEGNTHLILPKQIDQIVALLKDIAAAAQAAIALILQAQQPGFLGLRWPLSGVSPSLREILESLGLKRESLQLVIAYQTHKNSVATRNSIARMLDGDQMTDRHGSEYPGIGDSKSFTPGGEPPQKPSARQTYNANSTQTGERGWQVANNGEGLFLKESVDRGLDINRNAVQQGWDNFQISGNDCETAGTALQTLSSESCGKSAVAKAQTPRKPQHRPKKVAAQTIQNAKNFPKKLVAPQQARNAPNNQRLIDYSDSTGANTTTDNSGAKAGRNSLIKSEKTTTKSSESRE